MQLSDNVSWEPRRRVNIAIAKLMGNLDEFVLIHHFLNDLLTILFP